MDTKKSPGLGVFFAKLILIALPCFCIWGFSFFLLATSGELYSPDTLVELQRDGNQPSIVGMAYSDHVGYFKRELALIRKPAVLAIGTSRVLQFRARFFNDTRAFYNAGGIITSIQDFLDFEKSIPPGQEPKVILLGLDQNLFNAALTHKPVGHAKGHRPPPGWFKIYQNSWAVVYKDYFKHKFSMKQLITKKAVPQAIGFNAFANSEGYREDGSYRYGRFLKNPVDLNVRFNSKLEMAARGQGHFAFGESVSTKALRELALLLRNCKARNITVIGFLPPYAHPLYDALQHSGKHTYIFQLETLLKPLFLQQGFDFYNFSDLAVTGASESETIDGYHASEKAYLRLLILMAEHSGELQEYADLGRLESLLNSAASNFQVFEDELSWSRL